MWVEGKGVSGGYHVEIRGLPVLVFEVQPQKGVGGGGPKQNVPGLEKTKERKMSESVSTEKAGGDASCLAEKKRREEEMGKSKDTAVTNVPLSRSLEKQRNELPEWDKEGIELERSLQVISQSSGENNQEEYKETGSLGGAEGNPISNSLGRSGGIVSRMRTEIGKESEWGEKKQAKKKLASRNNRVNLRK